MSRYYTWPRTGGPFATKYDIRDGRENGYTLGNHPIVVANLERDLAVATKDAMNANRCTAITDEGRSVCRRSAKWLVTLCGTGKDNLGEEPPRRLCSHHTNQHRRGKVDGYAFVNAEIIG